MAEYNIHAKILLNERLGGAYNKYRMIRDDIWAMFGKPGEQLKLEL